MGVHPGCPVCSIVAASLVAVETDVGETISVAKVAFVCGLWSVAVVALLSAGPFSSAFTSFSPCLGVLVHSASPRHAVGCKVLPRLSVYVKCFHVSLADILVAQLWAAFESPSRCQLSIENVFWDAAILHAVDMPQPTQPALSEQGEHAWKVGSGQDLGVGHSISPGYAKDMVDASHVDGIESFLAHVEHTSVLTLTLTTSADALSPPRDVPPVNYILSHYPFIHVPIYSAADLFIQSSLNFPCGNRHHFSQDLHIHFAGLYISLSVSVFVSACLSASLSQSLFLTLFFLFPSFLPRPLFFFVSFVL